MERLPPTTQRDHTRESGGDLSARIYPIGVLHMGLPRLDLLQHFTLFLGLRVRFWRLQSLHLGM